MSASVQAVLIATSRYRGHRYGQNHPLGIPRVSLTLDLIRCYGALDDEESLECGIASSAELETFHSRDYLDALRQSESAGKVTAAFRDRYHIGTYENPFFADFFAVPATAAAGSILGAERVLAGQMAFNPAGGMHHAARDQARGFCYLNDPVLAIRRLRREGLRVLYVDLDAHHGDGVEAASVGDPGVVTLSLHMDTEYAYPFVGGAIADWGPGGGAVNLPLPRGLADDAYIPAFRRVWTAVRENFAADVVVLQAGTDVLAPDPLGRLAISTQGFLACVAQILQDSPQHPNGVPRLLVLGGGGYHPLALARCWTGLWGLLSGRELTDALPPAGRELLSAVEWDLDDEEDASTERLRTHRLDGDPPASDPARVAEVERRVDELLSSHPLMQGGARRRPA